MIFDIVEYMIMGWTMPKESRICGRVLTPPKKRRVLLASLSQSSQKRIAGLKTTQERLRGRQVLGSSCCCKTVNTVEKQ